MKKTPLSVTISALTGLIIFLVLLAVANVLSFNNSIYLQIVSFLNTKIIAIILFSLLLYLGELFFVFGFPLNFPAPIFNAFGGVILVNFIFDMMILGISFAELDLSFILKILEIIVAIIVFLLAIIIGYIHVFGSVGRKQREKKKSSRKRESELEDKLLDEIKDAFQDAAENIKKAITPEEEKPKKKSKKKTKKKTSSKKKVKKK